MKEGDLQSILEQVASGDLDAREASARIRGAGYLELGFAKLDLGRQERSGVAEAVFAEGKTPSEIQRIAAEMVAATGRLLVTRLDAQTADLLCEQHPAARYYERARVLTHGEPPETDTVVAILSAGTSDLDVAEEAAVCCEWLGCSVDRHYDVGIAGVHRLFAQIDEVRTADVVIVVAGMDGALPTLVAGLVREPVIALPTSVGYGASFAGLAALLTMLNACSPGIAVVNIDNGYGAAVLARRICQPPSERSKNIASP